jgi:hypothetical protein
MDREGNAGQAVQSVIGKPAGVTPAIGLRGDRPGIIDHPGDNHPFRMLLALRNAPMMIGVSHRIPTGVCASGYIPLRGVGIDGRYTVADLGAQITILIEGPVDRADAFNRLVFELMDDPFDRVDVIAQVRDLSGIIGKIARLYDSVRVAKGVMAEMLGDVIAALMGVDRLGRDGRIGLGIDGLALSWSVH